MSGWEIQDKQPSVLPIPPMNVEFTLLTGCFPLLLEQENYFKAILVTFSVTIFEHHSSQSEKAEKIFMGGFGKGRLLRTCLFHQCCGEGNVQNLSKHETNGLFLTSIKIHRLWALIYTSKHGIYFLWGELQLCCSCNSKELRKVVENWPVPVDNFPPPYWGLLHLVFGQHFQLEV